jgi:hypothetical protein
MVKTITSLALASAVAAMGVLAGCDAAVEPSPEPTEDALPKPAIQIDETWTAADGQWTFTGVVDPQGDPTAVILEIGPGPFSARIFDQEVPVSADLTDAGPISITTRELPDIPEICVRFAATNGAGTSVSSPLCIPHDLPSFVADAEPPTVTFTTPATGTRTDLSIATFTVAWTEADEGTGVSRRSLQRRVAEYTCGDFVDDGPPVTEPGPVTVADLVDRRCYEWVATVSDGAGNTSATTSGTVRVDLGSP